MDTARIDLSRSTETKELEDEIEMTIIKTPKKKKKKKKKRLRIKTSPETPEEIRYGGCSQIGYERFKGRKM